MKTRSVFLTLFFLSVTLIGYAQESTTTEKPKAKIWFGPKFGLDISHFTTDVNEITNQLGSNYQAGLLCQIGETLYLQPEVYYASYKTSASITDSSRTNFVKIPIMLGLKVLDIGLVSLHLNGGPLFSFQLDNTDRITGNQTLNWQLGAGADILGFITADLRYTLVPGKSISDQVSSITSSGLNLTVGLKFR